MMSNRNFIQLAVTVMFFQIAGCSGIGPGMLQVKYLGDSSKVATASTPNEFLVSPEGAQEIEREQQGRSKATRDFYYDEEFYYVCDGYNGSIPRTAIDAGLKINGMTGEVYDRENKTWLPDPRTKESLSR